VIDASRVQILEYATRPLTPAKAGEVERRVYLHAGIEKSASQFYRLTQRSVVAIDPDGFTQRAAQRRKERRVRVSTAPEQEGMAWLSSLLTAEDAAAAYREIDILARAAKRDDDRGINEIRADVHRDLILGKNRQHIQAHVYVVVHDSTLFGLDEFPGELRGFGPLPAGRIREMAYHTNAIWSGIRVDDNGTLRELAEEKYRPKTHLREKIVAREQFCQFPGCRELAERSDIDHLKPHRKGGRTNETNCHALCRHHHRLKHESLWYVQQLPSGELRWTSPDDITQTSSAEPIITWPGKPPF
jgi:hypothetical protein